jgi:hypothetical protein
MDGTAHFCQIMSLSRFTGHLGRPGVVIQRIRKLRRSIKRRVTFLWNVTGRRITLKGHRVASIEESCRFSPGQEVVVRSRAEIQATLNDWNALKGCGFMEEMWQYCGTRQRVLKRVERFMDERDYLIRKARGIVLLESVLCGGTIDFGRCDRSCYFFWRDEWLKKADNP